MAVKTSWSSGDVLTAADLTDTFASKLPYAFGTATPSTTDSGFLWYDSNSTPALAKYWDGSAFQTLAPAPGLELITTETVSTVSSVSINGCFTGDYTDYMMLFRLTASGGIVALQARMRASGTDATGSNYNSQALAVESSTVTGLRATSQTSGRVAAIDSTTGSFWLTIMSPNVATRTAIITQGLTRETTAISLNIEGMAHDVATAYDGITLFPTAGTMTGTIRIYGYKD